MVGGGRAARVILGTVPGMLDISSVDDVLARFDEAMASDEIIVPANATAEVLEECARIGLDLAAFSPRSG